MLDSYDLFFVEDEPVECKKVTEYYGCGWKGTLKECKSKYVHTSPESWMSLAGREGYEYYCPSCGRMLKANYTRMS